MSNNNTNWEPTDNRFVAFFDILGFKDRIMRSTHEEIYKDLTDLNLLFSEIEYFTNNETNISDVHIVNFSDSIVFFSKSDSILDFNTFIYTIAYAFKKILEKNIPVKAGVAYGKSSVDKQKNIFFGQPIIDAFNMEEDLNYLGIVCHHSIDNYISKLNNNPIMGIGLHIDYLLHSGLTPLKSGKIQHTNINWFSSYLDNLSYKKVEEILESLKLTMSGSPRRYIDNTYEFISNK